MDGGPSVNSMARIRLIKDDVHGRIAGAVNQFSRPLLYGAELLEIPTMIGLPTKSSTYPRSLQSYSFTAHNVRAPSILASSIISR
jgi:hypothetical protein